MILQKNRAGLGAAVLMSLSILLSGCGAAKEVVREKPPVKVIELKKTSLEVTLDYPSKLVPAEEIKVSAKVPGRVSKVYFEVGQQVKKGDVLFTLEAEDSQSLLKQTEAALSGTRENMRQKLAEAETGVNQAKLKYDDAKSLYDKNKALYEQGAISKQMLDNLETSLENSKLTMDMAQKNLEILKGSNSEGLATAMTNQAQSAVDAAAAQVENTVVKSPIDGKVSVCNVKAGELTSGGMLAYSIINSANMTAEINVPNEVQSHLSKGQVLKLKPGVSGAQPVDAVIDTVGLAADSRSGFYTVKLLLENKEEVYKPGMFAKVSVPVEKREGIFAVPGGAVVTENGIEYLYLVSEGSVVKKIIKTGVSAEKATQVEGDLKEGDRVILEGQSFLAEGELVDAVQGGMQ